MLYSILASEEAHGKVTRIRVPERHVLAVRADLLAAKRADLAALVEAGDPGDASRMIVTAGGIDWPYGGL